MGAVVTSQMYMICKNLAIEANLIISAKKKEQEKSELPPLSSACR